MTHFPKGWANRQANAAAHKAERDDPEEQARRAAIHAQRSGGLAAAEERRASNREHAAQTIRQPVETVIGILAELPPADLATVLDATRHGFDLGLFRDRLATMRAQLDHDRAKHANL